MPTPHINTVFTTSRNAPLRVRKFLNELVRVTPNSIKINRGRQNLYQILSKAIYYNARYIVMFKIIKGNPAVLTVIDLVTGSIKYEFILKGVTLFSEKFKNKNKIYVNNICIKMNNESEDRKCHDIAEMLIDIGFKVIQDCDYYASISYIKGICEVKFVDRNDLLIGPILRFKVDD